MSYVSQKRLGSAVTVTACLFLAGIMILVASFAGCAAANLTGTAKIHQQVTLSIADGCTIAVQAKTLYEAGKIPQTDTARHAINDAGAACEDAKTAFDQALLAEQLYRDAERDQVNTCTPQQGAPEPSVFPPCQAAAKLASDRKVKADSADATMNNKVSVLAAKSAAVKPLVPKQ